MARNPDVSRPASTQPVRRNEEPETSASLVDRWWTLHPGDSIGILCRQNWQAQKAQRAVRQVSTRSPIPCELLVGGSFYESPAARETRVFLEAVANPYDDAALLELCETRWGAGLLLGNPPVGVPAESWGVRVDPPLAWRSRLVPLGLTGSVYRDDLEPLRQRVGCLGMMLRSTSVMAWLVECDRALHPSLCQLPELDDDTERQRYARCLDHLITVMDNQFQDGPLTLHRLLSWLRLQVATNRNEDEPDLSPDGKVTALTVHKAKGLQFDRVVIPWTGTSFGPPRNVTTRTAVLGEPDEVRRLLWEWTPAGGGGSPFTNVPSGREREWGADDEATVLEETRLLYVAMTRAKKELVLLLGSGRTVSGAPDSWRALLEAGVTDG